MSLQDGHVPSSSIPWEYPDSLNTSIPVLSHPWSDRRFLKAVFKGVPWHGIDPLFSSRFVPTRTMADASAPAAPRSSLSSQRAAEERKWNMVSWASHLRVKRYAADRRPADRNHIIYPFVNYCPQLSSRMQGFHGYLKYECAQRSFIDFMW